MNDEKKKIPVSREKHYTIHEIAALWKMGRTRVAKIFRAEPGVLKVGVGSRSRLHVPESVMNRVYARLTAAGQENSETT